MVAGALLAAVGWLWHKGALAEKERDLKALGVEAAALREQLATEKARRSDDVSRLEKVVAGLQSDLEQQEERIAHDPDPQSRRRLLRDIGRGLFVAVPVAKGSGPAPG